jgi:hypothetical protein
MASRGQGFLIEMGQKKKSRNKNYTGGWHKCRQCIIIFQLLIYIFRIVIISEKNVSFDFWWCYNSAGWSRPAKTATLFDLTAATIMRDRINVWHTWVTLSEA